MASTSMKHGEKLYLVVIVINAKKFSSNTAFLSAESRQAVIISSAHGYINSFNSYPMSSTNYKGKDCWEACKRQNWVIYSKSIQQLCVVFVSLYVGMCKCLCLGKPEGNSRMPGAGVAGNCEPCDRVGNCTLVLCKNNEYHSLNIEKSSWWLPRACNPLLKSVRLLDETLHTPRRER